MLLNIGLRAALFAVIGLASPVSADAPADHSGFDQKPCADLGFAPTDFDEGVECGWVNVAESATGSRTNDLAVVVARAKKSSSKKAPVLYLHGGPGIATLDVMPRALKAKSWPLFREDRDIVFFDQRGTGRSKPKLCPTFDRTASIVPTSGDNGSMTFPNLHSAAKDCHKALVAQGVDAHAYSSTEIAKDADAVRRALGVSRWSIFATSFGSLPAAELIRYYPETIEALFLDSAFSVNSPNRAEQINATASSFAAFQRRCSASPDCGEQYPDIRALAATTIARLDKQPISTPSLRIDGEKFMEAVWTLMVDGSTATFVPQLLKRASMGDDAMIARFVKTFADPNYFGGYAHAQAWLVNCHDIFPRPSASLRATAIASNADIARGVVVEEQDKICDAIQPQHAPTEFYQPLNNHVPTLIMFGEFDPATPRSDAKAAQKFFKGATLVEIDGASHAPFYTDTCTKDIAVQFLENPKKPLSTQCLTQRPEFIFAGPTELEAFIAELPE